MREALLTAEIVLGAALLVCLLLLGVFLRRRLIMREGETTLAALRDAPDERWRTGLIRLSPTSLDFFPLFGVSIRPRRCLQRTGLDLGAGGSSEVRLEGVAPGSVVVPVTGLDRAGAPDHAELALPAGPYMAMRAWVEAAPPNELPVDW